jgi:hypothetical protein
MDVIPPGRQAEGRNPGIVRHGRHARVPAVNIDPGVCHRPMWSSIVGERWAARIDDGYLKRSGRRRCRAPATSAYKHESGNRTGQCKATADSQQSLPPPPPMTPPADLSA